MLSPSKIDIEKEDLVIVQSILQQWVPNYEVWAFGSRVTGKARKFSDLDLVVLTEKPLDLNVYIALKKAFSDSMLPFKVDLVDGAEIDEGFWQVIKQRFVKVQ